MSKKLMGTLMVLGLMMALALPAFASPETPDNSGPEVASPDVNDDINEAASEAKEDVSHPETETEVENGADSSPDAPGAR